MKIIVPPELSVIPSFRTGLAKLLEEHSYKMWWASAEEAEVFSKGIVEVNDYPRDAV